MSPRPVFIGRHAIVDANLVAERINEELARISRDPEIRAPGRGRRKALEDPAYLLRWLEERAAQ